MSKSTTTDVMRWYLLYQNGSTITEVIAAGPFHTHAECSAAWEVDTPYHEIALLDSSKVERHLKEDKRLSDWLKERSY